MPPQLPNQAQQVAQRVITTTETLRAQQLSRQRTAHQGVSGTRRSPMSVIFQLVAFLLMLALIAVLVKVGIGFTHGHHMF